MFKRYKNTKKYGEVAAVKVKEDENYQGEIEADIQTLNDSDFIRSVKISPSSEKVLTIETSASNFSTVDNLSYPFSC